LRSEEAHAFLLERVAQDPEPQARLAIEALAVFRHDEALRSDVLTRAEHSHTLVAFARQAFGE
jgi:hypothetical protein